MIDRRSVLKTLAAVPTLAAGAPAARRPNVVLILADDLGYGDLGCYGSRDTRTPHIDGIGARGVRFTQFYANAPECTPTRTALLTGRYQQRFGGLECAIGIGDVGRYDEAVWLQKRGELGLPASEPTMPRLLKQAGYDTAIFGKWHLGYLEKFRPGRHGFDEFFGILGGNADYFTHKEDSPLHAFYHNEQPITREGYLTDLIAEEAVGWLKRRSRNPFFLYVPFTAPHLPMQAPGRSSQDHGTYIRMTEALDGAVGAILAQLEAMHADENTIVIFASDNGAIKLGSNGGLRGFKSEVWEGGIREPLLVRWPAALKAGRTCTQVGITMDLLPTILTAAGIAPPAVKFDGVNLLPVMKGDAGQFPRTLFWRYKRLQNRRKAVRHGDMKYVWNNGKEELFDLAKDEREQTNLLAAAPDTAATLRARLAGWEKDVAAPRLREFPG